MNKTDVVALGELLIDFTMNGFSEQNNPLFEANPGGAPCNVLAILNKLGKKTSFIGKVGKDQFGYTLKNTLESIGIGTDNLCMDHEVPTTLAFVHTMKDGDREFSFYRNPGADMMLRSDEIKVEVIKNTKIFHFGTLSMTDIYVKEATIKALDIAKENNILISFDPNLRPALWKSLEDARMQMQYGIENCDILKISDDEILFFTKQNDINKAIEIMKRNYSFKIMFVTLGKRGSIACFDNKQVFVEGMPQNNTIDTTGAGDTFCGCVLNYILNYGFDSLDEIRLKEMLTFANCAAALVTTKKGALMSMPSKEEIEKMLSKIE